MLLRHWQVHVDVGVTVVTWRALFETLAARDIPLSPPSDPEALQCTGVATEREWTSDSKSARSVTVTSPAVKQG